MNKKKVLYFILILIGVLMFVYGGYDDSPGGQLIGVITSSVGIVGFIKSKRKTLIK